MNALFRTLAVAIIAVTAMMPWPSAGSSTLPLDTPAHFEASAAVFRGTVVGLKSYRDEGGLFYTKVSLRVDEAFKGKLPSIVLVIHRGGRVGSEGEVCGLSPDTVVGDEYLAFVSQAENGRLFWTQGAASAVHLGRRSTTGDYGDAAISLLEEVRTLASQHPNSGNDVTDQVGSITTDATTGMLGNVNSRFLQPDRGGPIPVLIDADSLPAGITLAQATNAVLQALNAWAAVTSLKFNIEGIGGFGQGADTITTPDEKLRIQLHDNYGRINTVNVLGIGGRAYFSSTSPAGWDAGGNVAGNEFGKSSYGYVVLEAGSASLSTLSTLAEVLCHEIGHALNMAHSSENPTEPNTTLKQAIMYYQAHADGRGASLGAYDPPIIRQCYPSNTPPYLSSPSYPLHRVIDGTTASSAVNIAGINEVEIRGYDLQNTALTVITNNQSASAGSLSLDGNKIKYIAPVGNFTDTSRIDPQIVLGSSFSSYATIYARLSDGTNASAFTMVRVISLCRDGVAPIDGIPNYWTQNYFGHTGPLAGDLSQATDDADGDRLTNFQEYLTGTNPKSTNSVLNITSFAPGMLSFQAKAYDLYEIMGSTNLTDWTVVTSFIPTNITLAARTSLPQTNIIATVSNLPTSGPYMFFCVRKVP